MRYSKEYQAWTAMFRRVNHPNSHKRYRGLEIDQRFQGQDGFDEFLREVGHAPTAKHSLDRKDNDKGYVSGNLRWATKKEQVQNQSNSRKLTAFGKTQTIMEWSKELAIPYSRIYMRLSQGYTDEEALTLPLQGRRA